MSYALIDTTDLTSLGNAIRTKTGGSSNLTVAEMATAVNGISSGGGDNISSLLTRTGSFTRGAAKVGGDFMALFGNKMSLTDITNLAYAFQYYNGQDLSSLTIELSDTSGSYPTINATNNAISTSYCFANCENLKYLPTFVFNSKNICNISYMFQGCKNLLSVDQFMNNMSFEDSGTTTNTQYFNTAYIFSNCQSLKHIPHLEKFHNNHLLSPTAHLYFNGFYYCSSLEELLNLPVIIPHSSGVIQSNMFNWTFYRCGTLNRIVFETNNGTPITTQWKKQQIDLSKNQSVGYHYTEMDRRDTSIPFVRNDADYALYKNDVYFTISQQYSRYNHTSAVETINSLPDCSATAGTSGSSMNKIIFNGNAGSKTDGGAISNLTSQEIAVATAKGWEVVIQ